MTKLACLCVFFLPSVVPTSVFDLFRFEELWEELFEKLNEFGNPWIGFFAKDGAV